MPIDLEPQADPTGPRARGRRATVVAAVVAVAALAVVLEVVRSDGGDDAARGAEPAPSTTEALTFTVTPVTDRGQAESSGLSGSRVLAGSGEIVGDVRGHTEMQGLANTSAAGHDGAEFVFGYFVYGAEVPTCGKGGFMLAAVTEYFEVDGDREALDQDGAWTGTWQVVPYSGRRGLSGLSGSGTLTGVLSDHTFAFTGTFSCDGSPVNPPTA